MTHLVLTRFNVNTFAKRGLGLPSESWMEHRIALFEEFCLPSMESQVEQDFEWLVFLDPSTSEGALQRLSAFRRRRHFITHFTEYCDGSYLEATAKLYLDSSGVLLTTRLDNDDALHSDCIRTIQNTLRGSTPRWLNFDHGFKLNSSGLYRSHHRSNAFLSRLEYGPQVQTALLDRHSDVNQKENVEHIHHYRAWLQLVHGRNVANKVGSKLCVISASEADHLLQGYAANIRSHVSRLYQIDKVKKHVNHIRPEPTNQ